MSTGNDIVALAATDSERTSRYRFYSRILSHSEQLDYSRLTDAGLSFSHYVWLLWSIKESVYKYCSRSDPRLVFAPLRIEVERLAPAASDGLYRAEGLFRGLVRYQGTVLFSQSQTSREVIATVVSDEPDFDRTRYGVRRIASSDRAGQSAAVREFVLRSLSALCPGAALRILKTSEGLPVVWAGEQPMDLPISLAHHDRYIAYSYRLPQTAARTQQATR